MMGFGIWIDEQVVLAYTGLGKDSSSGSGPRSVFMLVEICHN